MSVSTRLPLSDCISRIVECPDCGQPATVDHARGAMYNRQPVSSKWWVKLTCKGHCGAKLHPSKTLATVLDAQPDGPRRICLAEAVGKFCVCPRCQGKAQAAWHADNNMGHAIDCGACGIRPYGPDTIVEVIE
jgi:hypothetical protein